VSALVDARPHDKLEPINLMLNPDDDEHPQLTPPEQVVQQQLDAYNRRDIDAWLATYAADAEQYLLHGEPLASGIEAIRARMQDRFADPALYADLVSRTVMDNIVVDHEFVTRTFPEGVGRIEMICIYEVHAGLIRKATFAIGQAVDVDQGAKRMRSIDEQITLRPAMATDTHAARAIHHRAVRDVVMRQFGAWDEAVQDGFFDNAWHPERFESLSATGNLADTFAGNTIRRTSRSMKSTSTPPTRVKGSALESSWTLWPMPISWGFRWYCRHFT
jgi:hypothetical protein